MSTPLVECQDSLTAIAQFHADCATYLNSGGTPPELSSVTDVLDYSESLTHCVGQISSSGEFSTGAVQESMSFIASVGREMDMASRGKVILFLGAAAEYAEESTFYAQSRDFYIGVMKGGPTNGSIN